MFLAPAVFTPVGFLYMDFKPSLTEEVRFKCTIAHLSVLSNADNINDLPVIGSAEPNNQRSFYLQGSWEFHVMLRRCKSATAMGWLLQLLSGVVCRFPSVPAHIDDQTPRAGSCSQPRATELSLSLEFMTDCGCSPQN